MENFLVLEDVQDPGNVGTMIRGCAAGLMGISWKSRLYIYNMKCLFHVGESLPFASLSDANFLHSYSS